MVVDLTKEAVTTNELDEWLRSTNVDEPLHGSTSLSPTMSSLQYTRQQLDDDPSALLATATFGVQEQHQQQQSATDAEQHTQKKRKGRHDLYNNRRRSSLDFPSDNDCFGIDEHTALAAAHSNGLVDSNNDDGEEDVEILRRSSSSQMHNHNEYNERDTCANDINDDDQQSYCQEDEHQIDNSIIDELAREEYEKVSRQQDTTDEHVIDNSVIDELVREEYEKTARLVRASENDVTDDDIMSVVGSIINDGGGSSSHNNLMHTTTGIHKQSHHAHRMNLHLTGQQQQYLRRSSTSSLHHNMIGEMKKDDSTLPPLYRRANTLPSSFATEGESPFVTQKRQSLSPLSRVETVLLDVLRNESCDDSDSQLTEPYDFKPKGDSSCSRPIVYSRKDSYNSHQESCHGSQCTQEYPASPFSTRIQQQQARPSIISLPRSASSDLISAMEQSQRSQDFITQTIGDTSPIDMMTNFQYSRKGCLNMISKETKHSRGLLLSVLKYSNSPVSSPGQQVECGIQEDDYGYSRRASTGNVHTPQRRYSGQRPNMSYVGNNLFRRSSTSSAYNFKRNSWKEQEMMKSMLKRIPPLPGNNKGVLLGSPDTNNPMKPHTHFQYPPPSFQNLLSGGGGGETAGQLFDESAVKAELERIARQTRELERQHEG